MPNSTTTADPAVIAATINAVGQTGSAIAQSRINKKTMKWNEKMFDKQRQYALEDWQMMNDYNSPANQMARLKAAGLNPNLVYGHGADAGTAGSVRSTDVQSWSPKAPEFNAESVMGTYMNAKMNQVQTDNAEVQKTVLEREEQLKAAQILAVYANIANTESKTARNKFDLGLASDLRQTSLEAAKANVQKMQAQTTQIQTNTRFTENQDIRNTLMTTANINLAAYKMMDIIKGMEFKDYQIKEINARIENLIRDGKLKEFEIKMNSLGFTKNDPAYQRFLSNILLGKNAPEVDKRANEWIQDFKQKNPSLTKFLKWLETLSAY